MSTQRNLASSPDQDTPTTARAPAAFPVACTPESKRKRANSVDEQLPGNKRQTCLASEPLDWDEEVHPRGSGRLENEWGFIMKRVASASGSGKASDETIRSKLISPSDSGFRMQLRKNNVKGPIDSPAPVNLGQIERALDCDRSSMAPNDEDFEDYETFVIQAVNEATVREKSAALVFKSTRRKSGGRPLPYCRVSDQQYNRLPKDLGFNNRVTPPQPDVAIGFRWSAFASPDIQNIPGLIPHDNEYSIALPHLFCEYKQPGGAYLDAEAQAAYDGAYGTYMRRKALAQIGQPDIDRQAHIFSLASDGTAYRIYAHHFDSTSTTTQYYQSQLFKGCETAATPDGYKIMYKRIRNLQDLAFNNANALRERINQWQAAQKSTISQSEHRVPSTQDTPGIRSAHGPMTPSSATSPPFGQSLGLSEASGEAAVRDATSQLVGGQRGQKRPLSNGSIDGYQECQRRWS